MSAAAAYFVDYMEQFEPLVAEARRFGYVADGAVWLRPVLGQPVRQVGLVKDTEEAALSYFAQRYESFRTKVDDLLQKMEAAENRGSFLMKALHLKEQTLHYDGLGDFETLHRRLSEAEASIQQTVARNREKNLAAKIGFIQETEVLRDTVEWVTASEKIKDLRQGWLKTGPVDKEMTDELEIRFQAAVQVFFDRRKAFQADKKAMSNRALNRYKELIRQAEELQNSEQFEAASRQLKALQLAWREVGGSLPRKQAGDLWIRFRAANNYFFERQKTHLATARPDGEAPGSNATPEQILARKRALAEQSEALLNVPPQEAISRAKVLQAEWKKGGTVRGEESDRLWQRFMVACDKVFELSALDYYLRKKTGQPLPAAPAELAQTKVVALREFLKQDRQELEVLQENLDKLSPTPGNEAFRQMLQTKIRGFERKVRTKTDLIELFRPQT